MQANRKELSAPQPGGEQNQHIKKRLLVTNFRKTQLILILLFELDIYPAGLCVCSPSHIN